MNIIIIIIHRCFLDKFFHDIIIILHVLPPKSFIPPRGMIWLPRAVQPSRPASKDD